MAKAKVLTPAEKKLQATGLKLVLKDNRVLAKELAATLKTAQGVLAAATKAAGLETKAAQKLAAAAAAASDAAIKGINKSLVDAEKVFNKATATFEKLNAAAEAGKVKLEGQIAALLAPTPIGAPTPAARALAFVPKVVKAKTKAKVVEGDEEDESELEAA